MVLSTGRQRAPPQNYAASLLPYTSDQFQSQQFPPLELPSDLLSVTMYSSARYITDYGSSFFVYGSPRWSSGNRRMLPFTVLVLDFESRRGEISNLRAKKKRKGSTVAESSWRG